MGGVGSFTVGRLQCLADAPEFFLQIVLHQKADEYLAPEHPLQIPVCHGAKNYRDRLALVRVEIPLSLQGPWDIVNGIKDSEHILILDDFIILEYRLPSEENLNVLQLLANKALIVARLEGFLIQLPLL